MKTVSISPIPRLVRLQGKLTLTEEIYGPEGG